MKNNSTMKNLSNFNLLIIILLFSSCRQQPFTGTVHIIPYPNQIAIGTQYRPIGKNLSIYLSPESGMDKDYIEDLLSDTGVKCKFTNFKWIADLTFDIEPDTIGLEGYRLVSNDYGTKITASNTKGLFYGLQTFRQLITSQNNTLVIPFVEIADSPKFLWRALMLEKEVKKLLDEMARLKMNTFHWHLTDDQGWRIEIKKYPLLTKIGGKRDSTQIGNWNSNIYDGKVHEGFYTQEEIKEIIDYAAKRQITIVPEIEMPGHSEEVLATYPELSCSGKPYVNADFCIGTEKTFEFLENVLLEVIDLFPSEYIHIGGDEASKSSWKTCPRCQKRMADEHLNSVDELQSYMIHRIEKFLNDHGRKIIGWDEIIEGGLSPTATVMSWRGEEGGIKAVKAGNQAIMTPGKYCYLDAFQDAPNTQPMAIGGYLTLEKVYSFEPVPDSLSTKEAELILGVQGNVWTEHIPTPEHYEYMIYPRILALAEIGWSPSEVKKWDNFHTRALQAVNILREQGYNPFPLEKEIGDKPESYQKVNHLAIGKKVTYANPYSNHYAAQGEKTLVDGVRGGWMYNDDRWQGFIDCDFDVTIDLGKETDIKQVCAEFIQLKGPYVWLPKQVIISSSVDGEHYDTLATVDNDISPDIETLQFKEFGWEGNAKARYIRYKALSNGIAGGWLFTDEIRIK